MCGRYTLSVSNKPDVAKLGLQIAVVTRHDAPEEETRFLENVATNRGSQVQFFENEIDALKWLGV